MEDHRQKAVLSLGAVSSKVSSILDSYMVSGIRVCEVTSPHLHVPTAQGHQ